MRKDGLHIAKILNNILRADNEMLKQLEIYEVSIS